MIRLAFNVAGWAAWSPVRTDRAAWHDWAGLPPPPSQPPDPPPAVLRRRITGIGQRALQAAWSLPASHDAPIVFASRDGECARTISILDTLDHPDRFSPADFSLSVHHALAGLLSIARGNHAAHSSVAAGRDSLWCGVLEAASRCLADAPGTTVLLAYHAEPLPPPYGGFDEDDPETIALALEITTGPGTGLCLTAADSGPSPARAPGEAFLHTLLTGTPTTVQGERGLWHLARTHAVA